MSNISVMSKWLLAGGSLMVSGVLIAAFIIGDSTLLSSSGRVTLVIPAVTGFLMVLVSLTMDEYLKQKKWGQAIVTVLVSLSVVFFLIVFQWIFRRWF